MSKYLTIGNVTALLSVGAIIVGAFGKGALAAFLNNPDTAQTLFTVIGSIGTLIAGASKGISQ